MVGNSIVMSLNNKTSSVKWFIEFLSKFRYFCQQKYWKKLSHDCYHLGQGRDRLLNHWGRVMHICVSKLTIIGADNGLSPDRRQAIIWTNAEILLIGPLGTNISIILVEIHIFPFIQENMFEIVVWKMVAIQSCPECVKRTTSIYLEYYQPVLALHEVGCHLPAPSQFWEILLKMQIYIWPSSSKNGYFRLSVCLSVCLWHLFHNVPLIVSSWNFQEWLPMTEVMSMQKVKVRGQRSRSERSWPHLAVSGP